MKNEPMHDLKEEAVLEIGGNPLWNVNAIRASFDDIRTEGLDNHLVFRYLLWNTTQHDYRVGEEGEIEILVKLERSRGLQPSQGYVQIGAPVFIPARQRGERVPFAIHMKPPYIFTGSRLEPDATYGERQKHGQRLVRFVSANLGNLGGFVLFDRVNRYRIDFHRGW